MLTLDSLRKPKGWEVLAGADTGTYMGGAICFLSPKLDLYVVEEFPNYRYVGDGSIEEVGMTVSEWIRWMGTRLRHWTGSRTNSAWVDANTTFKTEVGHGLRFRMNKKHLELRTEITREYMRNGRIHFMPWLKIIPYEFQEAVYREESGGSGRQVRDKRKDHCLDGVEHVCSRRPNPDFVLNTRVKPRLIDQFTSMNQQPNAGRPLDPHLGVN